jgi:branched-subunit amino acid aminotransferase/4-amino-4-deoxychorismate lyase
MGSCGQSAGATWLNGQAWRDGEAPPADAAVLHDRGLLLGDGLFETLVVRRGLPVLWREHIERLTATADVLHFPVPDHFRGNARAGVEALLELADNGTRARGTLRITVTRGAGTSYGLDAPEALSPTILLRITPAKPHSRAPADRETAWIVDQPRIDPSNLLSGHKTTSSMWRVLAHETARHHGADLALMKTLEGDVAEADTATVFAVIDEVVVTPPLDRGILPSTTRGFIIAALEADGRPWEKRRLLPTELADASEVILSSSVTGVRALAAIDGLGLPEATPVAEWLDERYEALEGSF